MIFICYRGDDVPWAAETLAQILRQSLGEGDVFLDHLSIHLGGDFEDVLWGQLAKSDVMVVVVGYRWLAEIGDGRHIDSEDDFVRREIEFALRARVKLVPVLVDDVGDLEPERLPASVRPLASRQRLRLRRRSSEADMKHLLEKLEELVPALRKGADAVVIPVVPPRSSENRYELKRVKTRGQTVLGDGNTVSNGQSHG
jgi:TIR domain